MITCKDNEQSNIVAPCVLRQLMEKLHPSKKKKCCKNYRDGKRCKRCPKG